MDISHHEEDFISGQNLPVISNSFANLFYFDILVLF
jgi:hypothetical protein